MSKLNRESKIGYYEGNEGTRLGRDDLRGVSIMYLFGLNSESSVFLGESPLEMFALTCLD